jgi:hypothetical protein
MTPGSLSLGLSKLACMTITAERVSGFISTNHVLPARARGEGIVIISVRQVWKALDCAFPLIRGVLGAMKFRNTYHMALVAGEGPTEGPVDPYAFKLYPTAEAHYGSFGLHHRRATPHPG